MPAYKDEQRNSWFCSFYVTKNGKRWIKKKRGFATKREAQAWERKFLEQYTVDLDMTFQSFWELYLNDMKFRLRENTVRTKRYIVELKILPYFGSMKITDIKATDIRNWQNELIKQNNSYGKDGCYTDSAHDMLESPFALFFVCTCKDEIIPHPKKDKKKDILDNAVHIAFRS